MLFRGLTVVAAISMLVAAPVSARVDDHNPIEVSDPRGDSAGAPDITRVTVANDLAGNILFVVQVGNRTGFAANDAVAIFIDTDRSAQTGDPNTGVDYAIGFDAGVPAVAFARWNGTTFEDAPSTTLRGGWAPGYAAVINRAELANTTAFDFGVIAFLLEGEDSDLAPNTDFQTYTLAPPHIQTIAPRWAPTAPRAGASFRLSSVQLTLETEEKAAAATFTCRATLAGKRLRGTGRGGCTFKLAKTAKGKRLVVTVSATPTGGTAQTFPAYTFRVR
jgi:hypothetical protein